ncbi:DUF222 domain-containing protein [Microbispora hainanensis]|uniref:DUF222 domain-containing protein n=1 Tax=Microbispora hainanensis TaxID=568844 RepID=A0ABZ1SVJ1_9ACTN|nr:DUF222 domain-containing protein [Microbispora hainanensis]
MAQELALTPLPDDVDVCLAEAEELLFARDRITSALADRVGRVHRAGQAKQHGHASTRCWLRTSGGMTVGGAGRLLTLGAELPRLPKVREKFAAGELAAGVVEAICAAVAGLTDEQAGLAEPILVDLASKAGAAEVAKAGRHLRAVLDPDGEERDERADYGRRFLRVRPGKGGGVEGEFYLPREAGARLMALLQAYAKLRAQGDDRPLTVRQADALIALLEQKIVTELLVVVSAESLPTDPDNTNPETTDPTADPATQDPAAPATENPDADDAVSDVMGDPGAAGGADGPETPDGLDTAEAAPATDPAAGSGDAATGLRDEEPCGWGAGECGAGERRPGERRPGECEPRDTASTGAAEGDHTANAGSAEDDDTASTRSAESDETAPAKGDGCVRGAARSGATHVRRGASAWPAHGGGHSHTVPSHTVPSHAAPSHGAPSHGAPSDTAPSDTAPSDTAPSDTASSGATASDAPPSQAAPTEAAWPDPPPEDVSVCHTHAGPGPAGDCRHGHSTCRCDGQGAWRCCGEARCSRATQVPGTSGPSGPSGATPGGSGPERETPPGWASGTAPGAGRGTPGTAQAASQAASQGAAQGASRGAAQGGSPGSPGVSAGAMPGAFLGSALGASAGTFLGASLGMAPGTAPGLLLATGQVLPVSSVHRLARTSTLVRIVMNAEGQVLDMGRKVRLATPAQRRAIFARYATCWVDGCPLPATMCQIDHADNWSTGGLTDLKLLGPACQFHNRDRYQHPERYTRRKEGEDRWAFTYHRLGRIRRVSSESTT